MKNTLIKLLFISTFLFSAIIASIAQDVPVISTEENPVWFKIKSACTDPVTLNGAYTGPADLTGYVLIDPGTAETRIHATNIDTGDDALWALVQSGEIVKLKNKSTGRYMTDSHSLNYTGELVEWDEYGQDQYWIRSGGNSTIVIWNNLVCDRLNVGVINSNTAFHFFNQSDAKNILSALIFSAQKLQTDLISVDPGFISGDSEAVSIFDAAITVAQAVYDTGTSDDFEVAIAALEIAINDFENSPVNPITVSTDVDVTWYYLVSAATNDYCRGKAMVHPGSESGSSFHFDEQRIDPAMLWKVTDNGNGGYGLGNRASGLYFGAVSGVSQAIPAATTPTSYLINYLSEVGQFSIHAEGEQPLHCQANGSVIVQWPGGANTPSAWYFKTVENVEQQIDVTDIDILQGPVSTGIGNKNVSSLIFTMTAEGFTGAPILDNIKFDLKGTSNIDDVSNLSLYYMGTDVRFRPDSHILLGKGIISTDTITVAPEEEFELEAGKQNFAVVIDVAEEAAEGNRLITRVLSAQLSGSEPVIVSDPAPEFPMTIFLSQSTLFSPGDYGSKYYRIPAIVTANDGSLVTATDKRNYHQGDLPADIDTYIRRSVDNGISWSEPLMIAGGNTSTGYGDPALILEKESGKIICIMAHDRGFFGSTPTNPIRITMSESSDNGITWTGPVDITSSLYGMDCDNSISRNWNGMFVASGRGLQLENGRLMFAVAVRGTSSGIDNYVIYSDDKGETWEINTNLVHQGGDEAKLAQRNNGDIVISIRNHGNREWNISSDNGITWGTSTMHTDLIDPNCNGEIMSYTSTLDGYEKNRMLHSLAYASNRSNVSMLLSYDEGQSFPVVKTVCPTPSAYSTFTVLADGTIGMYYEDGSIGGGYDMVYVRFSTEWLTDGEDIWENPVSVKPEFRDSELAFNVWSRDHKIVVEGLAENEWSVYSIYGKHVNPNASLKPGIYIVTSQHRSQKVIVL